MKTLKKMAKMDFKMTKNQPKKQTGKIMKYYKKRTVKITKKNDQYG